MSLEGWYREFRRRIDTAGGDRPVVWMTRDEYLQICHLMMWTFRFESPGRAFGCPIVLVDQPPVVAVT